nr:hypothetical protein [Acetobacter persici]
MSAGTKDKDNLRPVFDSARSQIRLSQCFWSVQTDQRTPWICNRHLVRGGIRARNGCQSCRWRPEVRQGDFGQPGRGETTLARSTAVPDVGGDMVMVAIRRIERAPRIPAGYIQTEFAGIKILRGLNGADLKMDMPDPRAVWRAIPACPPGLPEKSGNIEGRRTYTHCPVLPDPGGRRAIGIDFDAVSLGIGQIHGFTHILVRGADNR